MNRASRIVPVLATGLLVALGASTPLIASLAVDRQLEQQTSRWDVGGVSLVLSQDDDPFQALELFSSDHSQVELNGGSAMGADEAAQAAAEAAGELLLTVPAREEVVAVPMLFATSRTPASSGVFWCCTWGDGNVLWVDDQSGRMVAFAGWVGPSSLYAVDSPFHEAVFSVLEYCEARYSVDSVKYDYEMEQGSAAARMDDAEQDDDVAVDDDVVSARFTVDLVRTEDGRREQCSVPLALEGEWLFFNM